MRFDPIRVLEACYAPGASDASWLQAIVEALAPLSDARSAWAQTVDAADPARLRVVTRARLGEEPDPTSVLFPEWCAASPAVVEAVFAPRPSVDWFTRRAHTALRHDRRGVLSAWRARPAERRESVAVLAADATRRGVALAFGQRPGYRPPSRLVHQLAQIAGHLASAVRLRRTLEPDIDPVDHADVAAVLDPSGRVHDATDGARSLAARDALRHAVRLVERARGRLRDTDPEAALALWRGLVDGRWSLVDQVEADGRRWVLARRNAPGEHDPKALTPRERAVAAYAALGQANKAIGFALGVSASTVSAHLESAQRKLRLASRGQLIEFFRAAGATP